MSIPNDIRPSGSGIREWLNVTLFGKDESEVEAKTKSYFGSYNPRGYSTRCTTGPTQHKQGYWYVRISRFSTCS